MLFKTYISPALLDQRSVVIFDLCLKENLLTLLDVAYSFHEVPFLCRIILNSAYVIIFRFRMAPVYEVQVGNEFGPYSRWHFSAVNVRFYGRSDPASRLDELIRQFESQLIPRQRRAVRLGKSDEKKVLVVLLLSKIFLKIFEISTF